MHALAQKVVQCQWYFDQSTDATVKRVSFLTVTTDLSRLFSLHVATATTVWANTSVHWFLLEWFDLSTNNLCHQNNFKDQNYINSQYSDFPFKPSSSCYLKNLIKVKNNIKCNNIMTVSKVLRRHKLQEQFQCDLAFILVSGWRDERLSSKRYFLTWCFIDGGV